MPEYLVTGAKGSVGRRLLERLESAVGVDIDEMDVTDAKQVWDVIASVRPRVIFHLAGAKHAPDGELDPAHVARVNVDGTLNVLRAAEAVGAKVVISSTCKACDPETAYGASKLIAERAVLNAGGVVVRYYNIPESDGNVFRLWESLPPGEPIAYTDCWRYFISIEQALELTLAAARLPCGRYIVDPGLPRHMRSVVEELYPGRTLVQIPRRRGDRYKEPLKAVCEDVWPLRENSLCEVLSPYDEKGSREYAPDLEAA